ncbi:class I SAM-dependent methyltransferase [Tolypothrix campylonemoides VB511288]|nr:class I SAM-dependent methyltransferase [Tolypothrix campylonemoides VB511288]
MVNLIRSALNSIKLGYRIARLKLSHVNSAPTIEYNKIADSYDEHYLKYVGKSALEMFEKLQIISGQHILDLACGTGFFTHLLAEKVGNQGKVFAVDFSSSMLELNKKKAQEQNFSNIIFIQSDALSFLESLPDHSTDGVVCAWAIGFMDHRKLSQELERVVKPGGFIGLIENKASSMKDCADLLIKVMMDYPEAIVKNIDVNLPKDKKYLVKNFCQRNFLVQHAWDGSVIVPCKNGNEVVNHLMKSGGLSVLVDSLKKTIIPQFFDKFIEYANEQFAKGKDGLVKYEFCAVVGKKVYDTNVISKKVRKD